MGVDRSAANFDYVSGSSDDTVNNVEMFISLAPDTPRENEIVMFSDCWFRWALLLHWYISEEGVGVKRRRQYK